MHARNAESTPISGLARFDQQRFATREKGGSPVHCKGRSNGFSRVAAIAR